ncbi:MAG: hypothetical protein GEV03_02975 [Streptosporangiales bacterium]|nr:hypothetical protein [Streptosporangiales bacterium]
MNLTWRHCSTCGEERGFEQPPCEDGHGPDCPEWVCVECGSAILMGFDLDDVEVPADAPSRAA